MLDHVWSLVNGPVLAFDAGRLPAGAAFAADLLSALRLDGHSLMLLDVVAGELPPADLETREPETMLAALAALRADLAATPEGADVRPGTAERLARAPLGHPAGIADFVRGDVLDWTAYTDGPRRGYRYATGTALVIEMVTASHAGEVAPHARRDVWERMRPAPHGPTGLPNDVDARLDELAGRITPAALAALDARAVSGSRDGRVVEGESWAELVHAATQVLWLTDRVRSAAIAQLRAALIVRTAHPGPVPLDALSAIGGAVQAWAAQDLLDDVRYAALIDPVIEVLGIA